MLFRKRGDGQHASPQKTAYKFSLEEACPELSPELAKPVKWQRPDNLHTGGGLAETFSNTPGAHKWHHYFTIYDELFGALRTKPIRMLEIGVYKGASMHVWRKHFHPDTKIVGIDIDPECTRFQDTRNNINIRIGPQQDAAFLAGVVQELGPFDLIIDDGSHIPSHMIGSFNNLFDAGLNPGGLYFVEDTHTNFWESHRDTERSFLDFCFGLVECMHAHYANNPGEHLFRVLGTDAIAYAEVPRITTLIEEIRFLDSVVVIRKAVDKVLPQSQHW